MKIQPIQANRKIVLWLSALALPPLIVVMFSVLPGRARSSMGNPNPITSAMVNYAIVDTGQTKCYNATNEITCPATGAAFDGQDAQYTGNIPSYTPSANGVTIYDNVTGLTWEHSPETNGDGVLNKSDKLTYANALAHCDAHGVSNYQGYNDWRLPTIKELYSLINFNGTDPSGYSGTDTSGLTPFIDTKTFAFVYGDTNAGERLIDSQYASSTLYIASASKLFGVNFADGRIKGYDLTMPNGTEKTFFVQCVRGNPSYGMNAFVDNGNQTITDNATGLMWAKSDSGVSLNWQDALAWVQTKNAQNYLGHNDWRLPDTKELQSIVDYSRSPSKTNSAAINPVFNATSFINEGGQTDWPWYWASTTHAAYNNMGATGVYIAFGRAGGWQKATPSATCYTFYDVHGAGAQRSDPKTSSGLVIMGPACNGGTAYGLGPQGDVQRAANYVRLVRDAQNEPATRYTIYLPIVTSISGKPAGYTIEQTLSDEAQRNTIAFDALAFITGNLGADSFFPPGKVADFWGFQYLRDNDPTQMGHNTDFLTRAALNMLYVLTPAQRAELIALAESQVDDINQYAYDRFELMDAFRRLLEGNLPAGSSGLSVAAVQAYSADLYILDGQISYERAQVMGGQISSLSASQRAYLDAMVGQGMLNWPVVDEPDELRGLARDVKVAVMTYAGDMFSWYAGSVEADVYFCPERQGTYFGSFYMKDAPAVGNPGYSIPVTLTAELGAEFLQILTPEQADIITNLVNDQKPALYEIVDRREDVSVLLRQFMAGGTPDQNSVLTLMGRYGELDGDIVARFAAAFAQVGQGLTAQQRTQLLTLRTDLLDDLAYPTGAYLYSQPIPMPTIPNTDFLFMIP
jgi:hypothetical protein